jgi:hypothetical protein
MIPKNPPIAKKNCKSQSELGLADCAKRLQLNYIFIFTYTHTDPLRNPKHKSPEKHKAPNLEFGKGLGQWEDEFDGKDYIEELVVGGAKSYSYKTNKEK